MVKTDRPNAPLGLALFFLSLAVVPVSLGVAGYDVSLSPSLSAAVEAWRNIAGVLGTNSQPSSDTELSLVKKYSFAPETAASAEEPVATEASPERFVAYCDPNLENAWNATEPGTPLVAAPVVQTTTRTRCARASVPSQRVVPDRVQRTISYAIPALVRTVARVEANTAKCLEREAGLLRVRELVRRSRALSESLMTVRLQEDVEVFVKIKPIALFAGTMMSLSEGEQAMPGEPATEVFHSAGPRFGVGASEEPETEEPKNFEFWFEF